MIFVFYHRGLFRRPVLSIRLLAFLNHMTTALFLSRSKNDPLRLKGSFLF